ncbi:hypothetical protein R1sor_010498 [Riccia sorocarpa]|uniref:Uncharacterized protein n=1 Tax=Riccia sorocarpa TaxID=122646 RepID=A0ABD3HY75_9MARC
MTARADVPNTDFRLNFRSSQHSSRPSSGYFSSQQSAQPTVTESQINLSQTSILSEPGLSNELWRYGSRGRDFISKRPRSPNRSAFPSYLFNNVKDGSTNSPLIAASSPVTTTGGLLQKIPDQLNEKCQSVSEFWRVISSRAKLMMMSYETCERIIAGITRVESLAGTLAEVMEQRLHALDKRLNGIFGGLDGLQRNLSNVQISIKEAALECMVSDILCSDFEVLLSLCSPR